MTPEELDPNLRQTSHFISENLESALNDLREEDPWTKVILFLVLENSLLNSRLEEIETRLSTFMPGSSKQSERQPTTPVQGAKAIYLRQSWS